MQPDSGLIILSKDEVAIIVVVMHDFMHMPEDIPLGCTKDQKKLYNKVVHTMSVKCAASVQLEVPPP
jgi:hypothetical protein